MLQRVTESRQLCQLLGAAIGGRNDVQRRLKGGKGERERWFFSIFFFCFTNIIERSIVILQCVCVCVCEPWCVSTCVTRRVLCFMSNYAN